MVQNLLGKFEIIYFFMNIRNFNPKKKVFIIAEIGNNHEGNISIAKKLVVSAAKAGADAVKFQTFITEDFVNENNTKRFKQLKKFQLSFYDFKILKKLAHKHNLLFISTPLDIKSVNFLSNEVDLIKIASGDNNFQYLIEKAIATNKKIIISTGMSNSSDIDNLLLFFKKHFTTRELKKKISLLHCVTSYPVDPKYANLNSIVYLKKKYNLNIGYSDHTIGPEACLAAVAVGATIIEKHFTLNKKFSNFRDHSLSADFLEFRYMVDSIRKIENLLGNVNKKIQPVEKKYVKLVRRSIYASKRIPKNDKIFLKDIKFLRPQNKQSTLDYKKIIGKKSKKTIQKNQIIKLNSLY